MNFTRNQYIVSASVVLVIIGAIIAIRTFSSEEKQQEITNQTNSSQLLDNSAVTNNQPIMDQNLNQDVATSTTPVKNFSHIITLETNKGVIKFKTYDADAPKTVQNFINLASKGFYDNLIFHRVIDRFMIQGGDPTGTGAGGPGYQFEDELNPETESYKNGYAQGTVAMANAGPNTNGSQFFIMVDNVPLQHDYSIFGQVIEGQEVANAISRVKTGANDRPEDEVVIIKATVSAVE